MIQFWIIISVLTGLAAVSAGSDALAASRSSRFTIRIKVFITIYQHLKLLTRFLLCKRFAEVSRSIREVNSAAALTRRCKTAGPACIDN